MPLLTDINEIHMDLVQLVVRDLRADGTINEKCEIHLRRKPIGEHEPFEIGSGQPGIWMATLGFKPVVTGAGYQDIKYGTAGVIVDQSGDGTNREQKSLAEILEHLIDRYNARRCIDLEGYCEQITMVEPGTFKVKLLDTAGKADTVLFEMWTLIRKTMTTR